jgi:hypothetical protein
MMMMMMKVQNKHEPHYTPLDAGPKQTPLETHWWRRILAQH